MQPVKQPRQLTPKELEFLATLRPAAKLATARKLLAEPPKPHFRDGYEEKRDRAQQRLEEAKHKRRLEIENQLIDVFAANPSIVGDLSFTEWQQAETQARLDSESRESGPSEQELEQLQHLSPKARLTEARRRGWA